MLGGSGFIGKWLVSSLDCLNANFGMNIEVEVFTRNIEKASKIFLPSRSEQISIRGHDFNQAVINLGEFDYIIHGATPSTIRTGLNNDDDVYIGTLNATKSILHTAEVNGKSLRVVNLSSGAVYGVQPKELFLRPESDFDLRARDLNSYSAAKIDSELMFSNGLASLNLISSSPRLFTFYGPGLELNEHFAIGNFLRDGLSGKMINVKGNPETVRSYMYPTDLIHWILKCLIAPENRNFNIGSENRITMSQLATLISELTSSKGIQAENQDIPANYYVPSTSNFRESYGVSEKITLETGLQRWIRWLLAKNFHA